MVNVQFDAESACSGGTGVNYCSVRILIDGIEGNPQSGKDFAFDSINNGAESPVSWEGHSMARGRCIQNTSTTALSVGVAVQRAVTNSATTFWLDDWELDVYRTTGRTQSA
jgi:hypothetical protein